MTNHESEDIVLFNDCQLINLHATSARKKEKRPKFPDWDAFRLRLARSLLRVKKLKE